MLRANIAHVEPHAVETQRLDRLQDRREANRRRACHGAMREVGRDVELNMLHVDLPVGSIVTPVARLRRIGPSRQRIAIPAIGLMFVGED